MIFFSSNPDSLNKILQGIVPSIPEFLTALISLGILLIVCTFLMYKPIKKSIELRRDYVSRNVEQSENRLRDAELKLQEAEKNVKNSKNLGRQIITTSVTEANDKSNKILSDAKDKSHQIVDSARNQAKSEIRDSRKKVKHEAIDIAMKVSEKLLIEKMNDEKDKKLINEFFEELDNEIK